jgi:hypothetical protein
MLGDGNSPFCNAIVKALELYYSFPNTPTKKNIDDILDLPAMLSTSLPLFNNKDINKL